MQILYEREILGEFISFLLSIISLSYRLIFAENEKMTGVRKNIGWRSLSDTIKKLLVTNDHQQRRKVQTVIKQPYRRKEKQVPFRHGLRSEDNASKLSDAFI